MDIGARDALDDDEAANGNLLADRENFILNGFIDGVFRAVEFAGAERLERRRLAGDNRSQNPVYKLDEGRVLRDKVGLRIDLDHCDGVAVFEYRYKTIRRDSVRFFSGGGKSLFSEQLDGGIDVPVRLHKRTLAVHQSRACFLFQVADHLCGYICHFLILLCEF